MMDQRGAIAADFKRDIQSPYDVATLHFLDSAGLRVKPDFGAFGPVVGDGPQAADARHDNHIAIGQSVRLSDE